MKTTCLRRCLLTLPLLILTACGPPKPENTAEGGAALARAKNCLGCHAVDRKIVGPAFKDVAARYADDSGAAARLAAKIRAGGAGAWGVLPMPANSQVSEAEAAQLAAWVLAVK